MSQHSDIKSVLESLGYKLIDAGREWRTNAIYRGGKNTNSLKIYKDTGVWTDYVEYGKPLPFSKLVELTIKSQNGDPQSYKKIIDGSVQFTAKTSDKIEMIKVYHESCLKKLRTDYSFYLKRKISPETQDLFKTGFASEGKMYKRMVFPIYNDKEQIIGFSGRSVFPNAKIKWKHIGPRNKWLHPLYLPNSKSLESIQNDKKIFIVESLGDCMALFEHGIRNVIISFGISLSSKVIAFLNTLELNEIVLAYNNEPNAHRRAVEAYMNLSHYFSPSKLSILLPPNGSEDLGNAHQNNEDLLAWSQQSVEDQLPKITKNVKHDNKWRYQFANHYLIQ